MSDTETDHDVRKPVPQARTIAMPARGYQPSKAEKEEAIDMPCADIETVRSAFFRPIKTVADDAD